MSTHAYIIINVLFIVLSIITNSLLLISLLLLRREPTSSFNVFVLSLAFSNTIIGVLLAESSIADYLSPLAVNSYRCFIVPFLRLFSSSSAIFSMVAIALDLYRAVRKIDVAPNRRSWGTAGLIAVWTASAIYSSRILLQMVIGGDHCVLIPVSELPVVVTSLPGMDDFGISSSTIETGRQSSSLLPIAADDRFSSVLPSTSFCSSSLPVSTGTAFAGATSIGEGAATVSDNGINIWNDSSLISVTRLIKGTTLYDVDLTSDVGLTYDTDVTTSDTNNDTTSYDTDGGTVYPPYLTICNLVVDDGISDIIFILLDLFILFLLPVLVQISLYYVIIRSLWRSSVALGNSAMVTGQQRYLVRMSVTILASFVLCWAPWHAVRLALPSLRATGWHGYGVTAKQVTMILACCNCWITPLAYSAFNRRLRTQVRRIFGCKAGSSVVVPEERGTGRTGSADGSRREPLP